MKLSLIIVHWHTADLLSKQLRMFEHLTDVEILVVNNDSEDKLPARISSLPNVKIIESDLNQGFAAGCNQGAVQAQGEWLLFLNPDFHISVDGVNYLLAKAQEEKLDAASPDLKDENYRKPVPSFLSLLSEFSPLGKLIPLSIFEHRTLVGGCLLIRRSSFLELGGWDERFFLWFEDSDLTKRIDDFGFQYDFIKGVPLEHLGAASFAPLNKEYKRSIFFLSMRLFAQKHFSPRSMRQLARLTRRFSKENLLPVDPNITASVIVPNQKRVLIENFLRDNIKSFDLRKEELIIVSSAPDLLSLKRQYPGVIFIQLAMNLGFAATVNLGLQRARGKYIGTVNDDTILPKAWVAQLITHFKSKVGSVSPRVLTVDGELESQGIGVLPQGKAFAHKELHELVTTSAFNGACVLFNREALQKVGLFDQFFQSYLEDIDLGLRLDKAGWKNVAVGVEIRHIGQQTSKGMGSYKEWLDVRNWWLVMFKNFGPSHWRKNFIPIITERARNLSGYFKSLE